MEKEFTLKSIVDFMEAHGFHVRQGEEHYEYCNRTVVQDEKGFAKYTGNRKTVSISIEIESPVKAN